MRKYALVNSGTVMEIFVDEDGGTPLKQRIPAQMFDELVPIPKNVDNMVAVGYSYDGNSFFKALPPQPPAPGTVKQYIPVYLIRERMERDQTWDRMVTLLASDMPTMVKVLTLQNGIDPADEQARQLIAASGSDPNIILAPMTE
jgi:hypothetical protein